MGKCLSCCEPPDRPIQNGHAGNTTPTKTTSASHSLTQGFPAPAEKSAAQLGAGEPQGGRNQTNGSSSSSKMFSPYTKLPPIRKTSSNDAKRLSLTRDFSEAKIQALFEQYKDPEEDAILADGIEKLCLDLEVRPEEFKVLVLAWKFEAETMCRFMRNEFINGCRKLRVDTIKGIQSKFPEMLQEVQNKQTFKDLYRWTYKFGLDTDVGQRTLPVDMAISLWHLVFSQHQAPIIQRWLAFLEKHPSIRGIPKDTWDMFLNFTEAVGDDLSCYDDTEAWPSLFDDFVEYENDRENQNVQPDKMEKEEIE